MTGKWPIFGTTMLFDNIIIIIIMAMGKQLQCYSDHNDGIGNGNWITQENEAKKKRKKFNQELVTLA